MKDFKIQRCITFYEKKGDTFIGDRILSEEEVSLRELKEIFGYSEKDSLLYEQYDINNEIASMLSDKIDFTFNFDKYDYFLETFSVDANKKTGNGIRLKDC
ncbi:hypothetical protein OOZ15_05380 [Galbibacter sp. EGI 63066]|uniref:DUF7683 domain-containing protein n=1 Tax=Galbibacter sp. EGI 63066 TaxID=2993559 RepID=UPI0022498522|nr:hypothetical protein [Galbibacter sp. EGI 63066]MCX2679368.1 hypothetical protein [Galbibacter sp. EGI 63066]